MLNMLGGEISVSTVSLILGDLKHPDPNGSSWARLSLYHASIHPPTFCQRRAIVTLWGLKAK